MRGKTNRPIATARNQVPELLKYKQVEELLALSPRSVRRLVESGELRVTYVGRRSPRFKPEHVLAFVERGVVHRSTT